MKIIAVFKTHFDIGFTRLSREVVDQYSGKMLRDVIDVCERTAPLGKGKRYVWTMAAWPLQAALDNAEPALRKKAEALIREGQIVTHGLPFTTHTEFLSREELDYGCLLAKRLCKKYGVPMPISGKMTDVPGHTANLVSVCRKNGIQFLHLGCNPASMPPDVPTLFWWEDYEGNRILTMYNKTYGSTVLPPKDWPFPVWLAMRQTNDNIGPQGPDVIDAITAEAGENEVEVGTMDDFYREISACDLSGLPVVRGELGDSWIHGVGTYPAEVGLLRGARETLRLAQAAAAKSGTDISAEEETYYANALLFGEHTWGMDIKTHLGWQRAYDKADFTAQRVEDRYMRVEESWNEQRDRVKAAVAAADAAFEKTGCKREKSVADAHSPYHLIEKNGIVQIQMPDGTLVTPWYEYRIIPTEQMHKFMLGYMSRVYNWAVADFGRESYPEDEGHLFADEKPAAKHNPDGSITVAFTPDAKSYTAYGNCKGYTVTYLPVSDGVLVTLSLQGKQASPMLEAGNFTFTLSGPNNEPLCVTKSGAELDPECDIVKNANTALFCVDEYAAIGNTAVIAYDAPLVGFGGNKVFEKNTGTFVRPADKSLTFNLFNNQWGTNFPQWTEGDFTFTFKLTSLDSARKTYPRIVPRKK